MGKIRVGLLFGGKSSEHEISILSARNVARALSPAKYEVILIGISKEGKWFLQEDAKKLLDSKDLSLPNFEKEVRLVGQENGAELLIENSSNGKIDVVFPVMHGTNSEDGTIQGLLKLANVPFVGSGVLGSAIGMDKDVAKRLLRDAGIKTAKFLTYHNDKEIDFENIVKELGLPFFVKPANNGSSVGISKVKGEQSFEDAIKLAFSYDTKIIIEEFIKGREIEISVLGNDDVKVSLPGEIITTREFYDYEAKYIDETSTRTEVPADIDESKIKEIQDVAAKAFKALDLEGMARIDFFLKENGEIFLNEVNTIPGFTNISMYPKMWEASGLSYEKLIDELINLAIARHEKQLTLKSSLT